MAHYVVDVAVKPTPIVDGIVRTVWKVEVLRFDKPGGKPVKVGTTEVRAFRRSTGLALAAKAGEDLKQRDLAPLIRDKQEEIKRVEAAANYYRE